MEDGFEVPDVVKARPLEVAVGKGDFFIIYMDGDIIGQLFKKEVVELFECQVLDEPGGHLRVIVTLFVFGIAHVSDMTGKVPVEHACGHLCFFDFLPDVVAVGYGVSEVVDFLGLGCSCIFKAAA